MTCSEELPPPLPLVLWYDWICIPFCNTICLIQMSNKGSKCSNVTFTAFSSHSFRVQHDSFWANVYLKGDSFCFGICNTQWEVLLSKQVNYNQVVVKSQILQECFLQNFNIQKFQNKEHSNSRTFQGLSRTYSVFKDFQGPGIFFQNSRTFKDFSRTLWTLIMSQTDRQTQHCSISATVSTVG